MKTIITATAMLMLVTSASAISPAIAADCPYDAAQKEAIREALAFIPCVLDQRTASLVLETERLKTKARDLYPGRPAEQWKYFYDNIHMQLGTAAR